MISSEVNSCEKNFSLQEILNSFGKDDDLGKCATCSNLVYHDGIMTCKLIEDFGGSCK